MNHKRNLPYLFFVIVNCLWAVTFIAVPGWLAVMLWLYVATPRVLPLWLNNGSQGFIVAFALSFLMVKIGGMIAGFSLGVFLFSKFMTQQQIETWLLSGRPMFGYTTFVKRLIRAIYR